MEALVDVLGVSKRYGTNLAVDNLSFAVPAGLIYGLLGPNGAGKTTTISMISGLLAPDAGEVLVAGLSVISRPREAKALMGVVPQDIALYQTLSAYENLNFWGRLYGLGGAELAANVERVLELVGLRDRAREPIDTYSGGMKRRINIAVGLLHSPRLLLLDEPTVGVDPQSRRSVLDTIKDLNADGMTVLYTSHNMDEVEEMCSVVAIMDRGQMIAEGSQTELQKLVGDRDLVQLETDSDLPSPSVLANLDWVDSVDVRGSGIDVTVPDGSASLPRLIGVLAQAGIGVTSVRVKQPNLESVFLHLTGRTLRD